MKELFSAIIRTVLVLAGCVVGGPVYAEISINEFAVEVRPARDGSVTFTETIIVQSDPAKPFTGIVRNLPRKWLSSDEKLILPSTPIVNFLFRNDASEPFEVGEVEDALSLNFGLKERVLPQGTYRYTLQYRVSNLLISEEAFVRLRYLVPDKWIVPIAHVSTSVVLPEGVPVPQLEAQIEDYDFESGKSRNRKTLSVSGVEGRQFFLTLPATPSNASYIVIWRLPRLF